MRVADIVSQGFDVETVKRVERLLYLAEYKRRQSAPGVKVGPKNFGRDRRYPIVNRFRDSGGPAPPPRRVDRAEGASRNVGAVRGVIPRAFARNERDEFALSDKWHELRSRERDPPLLTRR